MHAGCSVIRKLNGWHLIQLCTFYYGMDFAGMTVPEALDLFHKIRDQKILIEY